MGKQALPPLPPGAPGRPKNNRYREQYGVIVICRDEADQKRAYDWLRRFRRPIRVVTT